MEGTSVLAQNKKKTPETKTAAKASSGEQSVLGAAKKDHKPVTFYKKAWFWIIIAVVVLGIAGLITFLVINANLTAEAIKKFDDNVSAANKAVNSFESSYSDIYSESGLAGYYSKSNDRSISLRNKCLEKFGGNESIINTIDKIDDYRYMTGEEAVDEFGSGKVRELSDNFEKATSVYKDANKNISDCKKMLDDALNEDVKISFGEFTVTESTWWDDTELEVTIKNTSDTSHKFTFYVEAQDENGDKIDDDYIYTTTLSVGEETTEKAFEYVYSKDIEKMKTAKFVVKKLQEN